MKHFLRSLLLAAVFSAALPLYAADLTVTASSVVASNSATVVRGKAGTTITAGQAVYRATDGTYKLADANGASPLYKVAGIALNNAGTGQPISICTGDNAFTIGATVAVGDTIWLSTTPGGMTATASDVATGSQYVTVMGVAISTTKIKLKPLRADALSSPTPTPTPTP
jgi:hypothetical protein